ncbi:hypothetical protein JCGZ_22989 [Jatropha curcas]|uniref:Uncharacterized protein n=1 Tax=Jatropha curcas TaxID=180498 RepID=A0A067K120_JATCU|nr:hypothetical protein JCGZ_22989 [Jatropha curcas]
METLSHRLVDNIYQSRRLVQTISKATDNHHSASPLLFTIKGQPSQWSILDFKPPFGAQHFIKVIVWRKQSQKLLTTSMAHLLYSSSSKGEPT